LALRRQTSGQVIEVVSLLDDGRSVEVVRQSDRGQQIAVFADQTAKRVRVQIYYIPAVKK